MQKKLIRTAALIGLFAISTNANAGFWAPGTTTADKVGDVLGAVGVLFGDTKAATNGGTKVASTGVDTEYVARFSIRDWRYSRFLEPAATAIKRVTGVSMKNSWVVDPSEELGPVIKGKESNGATIVWGDLDFFNTQYSYTPAQWSGFNLKQTQFASNPILLIVREDAPIHKLTKEQFQSLLSGQVTKIAPAGSNGQKWDVEIKIVWSEGGLISETLRRDLLQGKRLGENVEIVTGYHGYNNYKYFLSDVTKSVRNTFKIPRNKGEVGKLVIGIIDTWDAYPYRKTMEDLRPLDLDFKLDIPFNVITKGNPSPSVASVLNYFNDEGKDFVAPPKLFK
jgi:hypothetical protein